MTPLNNNNPYFTDGTTYLNNVGRKLIDFLLPLLILCCVFGMFYGGKALAEGKPIMYWIEDKKGEIAFEQLRHWDLDSRWNKALKEYPNFGFTDSAFWLCLNFENPGAVQTDMLLELAFPLHDQLDAYLLNDAGEIIKTYQTGDQRAFTERPLNHRNFLFPHTVAPGEKLRIIVRAQSSDTMYLPATVWKSSDFITKDQHQALFLGLFFGCLSIMLVYNLFLYFSTGQKNYLYYVIFTASILYLQLAQKNLGFQYFWPEYPVFNHISIPVSSLLAICTSLFFILNFLKLDKTQYAKTISVFQTFIWITLLGTVATTLVLLNPFPVIPYSTIILTIAVMGALTTAIIMAVLLKLALNGIRSAQILSVAWTSLLAGSFLFALGRLGVPIPMFISENAMLVGSTFEAVLISFALARQIKHEREARSRAQELALNHARKSRAAQSELLLLQQQATQHLEQEVRERTKKLETAMKNLTLANNKLDSLAHLDGLTGLSNRRGFDQECEHIWLHNLQNKTPVSLLMADIDYFKKVNDTYGHLAGDQCLVRVATAIKDCLQHTESLNARFGGEEFIILLPNADTPAAIKLAEHIRQSIEQLSIEHDGHTIRFTLSLGIATVVPTLDTSCTELIARADQSLYLAKENGRNRVTTLDNYVSRPQRTTNKPSTHTTSKPDASPSTTHTAEIEIMA